MAKRLLLVLGITLLATTSAYAYAGYTWVKLAVLVKIKLNNIQGIYNFY